MYYNCVVPFKIFFPLQQGSKDSQTEEGGGGGGGGMFSRRKKSTRKTRRRTRHPPIDRASKYFVVSCSLRISLLCKNCTHYYICCPINSEVKIIYVLL